MSVSAYEKAWSFRFREVDRMAVLGTLKIEHVVCYGHGYHNEPQRVRRWAAIPSSIVTFTQAVDLAAMWYGTD